MDIVDQLKAFVATAQTGSFTAAANQIGISNRLTSKYVAELEQRLGTRLFQRTTRKVGLTPVGEDLLMRAPAILDNLDDMLSEISEGSKSLSGTVRIAAPVTFGEMHVVKMLRRFSADHPDLTFDLRLSDKVTDLAAEGIDLAFRIGRTDMLSLKARRLGSARSVVAASPYYLAKFGEPERPQDLLNHKCIVDTNRRDARRWSFSQDGNEFPVQIQGQFHVNSARASVELASEGLGIVNAPRFAVVDAFKSGALIQLLENYEGEAAAINAVYLEGRTLPRRLRALIDFAVKDLRNSEFL